MYIIICKIDSQWEFAAWLRELKLGLYNNLDDMMVYYSHFLKSFFLMAEENNH